MDPKDMTGKSVRDHDKDRVHKSSQRKSSSTGVLAQALLTIGGTATVWAIESSADASSATLFRLAWLANSVFILHIIIASRRAGEFFRPTVVVSIFLFLFSAGKIVLFSFGYQFPEPDVLFRESLESIVRAFKFFITSYLWFGLGLVLIPRMRDKANSTYGESAKQQAWTAGIRLAGVLCVVVGFPAFAITNVQNAVVVSTVGYSGYYEEGARIESPLLTLSYFFLTGLVFLGCSGSPRWRKISIVVIVLLAVFRLTLGDRGEGFIYLFTAYFLYTLGPNATAIARRVWSFLLAGLAVVLIPIVGAMRQTFGGGSSFTLEGGLLELPVGTLNTLGATLFPTVKVVELVDSGWPLSGGLSYLSSVVRLFPGFLRPGDLDVLVSENVHGSPASWLQETLGLSYGPGFTPFAEAYLNFGPVGGVIMMFVFGLIFGLLFRLPPEPDRQGVVRLAICLSSFILVAFVVRGSMNFMVPYLFRYVALPVLLAGILAATSAGFQRKESS